MAVIKWRDSYNTGIGKIDQEHRKLVDLIEVMHGVVRDKGAKEDVIKALHKVTNYTIEHFANEEELMKEHDYPEMEDHVFQHEKLKSEATKFIQILEESDREITQDIYHFLREWLIDHILAADMKLGQYILERK